MATREQLTAKRLDALIELLQSKGVIEEEWRDELQEFRDLETGRAVSQAARKGRVPPKPLNGGENE